MKHSNKILRTFGEMGLWGLANIICMILPLALVFFVGSEVVKWSPWRLSLYLTLTAIVSSTWGSWATLVWTRTRALRAVQQAMTTLPGLATIGGAVALFYLLPSKWLVAVMFGMAGLGMIAASFFLTGGIFTKNQNPGRLQYLAGLVVYPLATTTAGGLVASVWYTMLNRPASGGWRDLISVATLMMTVMAVALISTIVPAAISRLCHTGANQMSNRLK